MAKKTALFKAHVKYGGDITEFAGYDLPVRYEGYGVIAEHNAVRTRAGLFDVSHMGEFIISGENAENALNYALTNDISGMYNGQVRYSPLPNSNGGAIDDVLVYRFNAQKFMLVVNAANCQKDEKHLQTILPKDVEFKNISDSIAQLALQGPLYKEIMLKLAKEEDLPQKYYSFKDSVEVAGTRCLVSRTGYTGEGGYEIYCNNNEALGLYYAIMEAGSGMGLVAAGLGARDTLRLEAGMPLYGHELGEDIPLNEVGLDFAIKMSKPDFVGKNALSAHNAEYARVGARVFKGIARQHDKVFCGNECVGMVTSGTHSPALGYPIAMLRIKKEFAAQPLCAEVRGRKLDLEVVSLPFYKGN